MGHGMSDGGNLGTCDNREGGDDRRKEWPTEKQKRAGGRCHRGNKKPRRLEPTGRVVGFYLITRKGREEEEESEKETQGKVA